MGDAETKTARPRPVSDDPKAEAGSFEIERNGQETMDGIASELASLAIGRARSKAEVGTLLATVKEVWSERAAIREYLGGVPRWRAEREAVADTYESMGVRAVPESEVPAAWKKPKQRNRPAR